MMNRQIPCVAAAQSAESTHPFVRPHLHREADPPVAGEGSLGLVAEELVDEGAVCVRACAWAAPEAGWGVREAGSGRNGHTYIATTPSMRSAVFPQRENGGHGAGWRRRSPSQRTNEDEPGEQDPADVHTQHGHLQPKSKQKCLKACSYKGMNAQHGTP